MKRLPSIQPKRWPIIRHIRWWKLRRKVHRHYDMWSELGYLPVNAHIDDEVLDKVWRGQA